MTVTAPPRPPSSNDLQDLEAADALIEEARRRARRRRRRNGVCVLLAIGAGAGLFLGFGQRGDSGPAASSGIRGSPGQIETAVAGHFVVITMRGHVAARRTLHSTGGSMHYRLVGKFRVVWRVPAAALKRGRSFRSTSATVTGTTSATFDKSPATSCRGTLTVRSKPFELRVVQVGYSAYLSSATIGVMASPSPIATATSAACPRGLFASRWRLTSEKRRHGWWIYNHPGGAFYRKSFTPYPKGGDSEGWGQGWGPAGSFTWLALFSMQRTARNGQTPSFQRIIRVKYAPLLGLFLKAVQPCITNQFAACRRTDRAVRRAVEQLVTALKQADVPYGLVKGDRELRHGLAVLDTALALRIRLAHQATLGPFVGADADIINALNLMDKAAYDLNKEDPNLLLRPM